MEQVALGSRVACRQGLGLSLPGTGRCPEEAAPAVFRPRSRSLPGDMGQGPSDLGQGRGGHSRAGMQYMHRNECDRQVVTKEHVYQLGVPRAKPGDAG